MNNQFAILGYPLGHTMSPPIHKRLFSLSGKAADYSVAMIKPEEFDLPATADFLRSLAGFNITLPYKERIIPLLSKVDPAAQRYHSVNVVANTPQGMVGYNTDVYGFLKTLETMGIALPGKTVCVAGAGGVGRTFAIECALSGAAVTLATRPTGEQSAQRIIADAKALMPQVKIEHALLNGLNRPFDLLINATPCGMYPKTQVSPIGQELLQGCRAVFDCIYNPTKTKLLLDSERLNIPSAGGMDMLVWQAVKAHEIWYGGTFHTADISQLIRDMSAQVDQDFPATLA